jgi:hypothetical protein
MGNNKALEIVYAKIRELEQEKNQLSKSQMR